MKAELGQSRKFRNLICAVLLICGLLAGCTAKPTQPPETAQPPQNTTAAPPTDTAPPVNEEADASLVSFRQAMVETPQLFAVAFFGYAEQNAAPLALMEEAAPQLCADLPFLLTAPQERIIGNAGYLFCIVPADENATVVVNRRLRNEEAEILYRSEQGDPIVVMCPNDKDIPDTEVIITDSNGSVAAWYPQVDSDYRVMPLRNDQEESLIFDFTPYEELPATWLGI